MPSDTRLPQRYLTRWLPADKAEPLLAWPAQRHSGETLIISPLSVSQRQQALTILEAAAAAKRQADAAAELRLTPRRSGYFVALGPLTDD